MTAPPDETHVLDYSEIDALDEISGDEQYALVWCDRHEKFEWHWIDRSLISGPVKPANRKRRSN